MRLISSLIILLLALPCWADEITDIIPSIIAIESSGNSYAVSEDGCIGLMQISPQVLKEWNVWRKQDEDDYIKACDKMWAQNQKDHRVGKNLNTFVLKVKRWDEQYILNDLFKPEINKKLGEWYLRKLKDHYLKEHYTIERMLAAYNGGITRLKQCNYDINKMPNETRRYIKKVMAVYKRQMVKGNKQ